VTWRAAAPGAQRLQIVNRQSIAGQIELDIQALGWNDRKDRTEPVPCRAIADPLGRA